MSDVYWWSEEATGGLKALKERFRTKLLAKCLDQLPSLWECYHDNRPPSLWEHDLDYLERGKFPQWMYGFKRYPHMVHIKEPTREKLVVLAEHYHITNHLDRDSYRYDRSRISALLECLGTHTLILRSDWEQFAGELRRAQLRAAAVAAAAAEEQRRSVLSASS